MTAAPVLDTEAAVELCAGYGGLYRAMRLAGWPVHLAAVSEDNDDASKVLDAQHPGVPNLGDMTTADWDALAAQERINILCGGIPCQGWSGAGQQLGSEDERDLWPVRKTEPDGTLRRGMLDAVRALRPRVVVLENVARLVTAEGGQAWGVIVSDLAALGYAVGWVTVGACQVGACHHRHRVFLVAVNGGMVAPPAGLLFGVPVSAATKWPTAGVVADGMLWPLPVEVCGFDGPLLPTPTVRDASRGAGRKFAEGSPLSEVVALIAGQPGRFGRYEAVVRRQERLFGMPAPDPTVPGRLGRPRLSPWFTEWMVGLPQGFLTDHLDRKAAVARAGNGVVPQQAAYAFRLLGEYLPGLRFERAGVAA